MFSIISSAEVVSMKSVKMMIRLRFGVRAFRSVSARVWFVSRATGTRSAVQLRNRAKA